MMPTALGTQLPVAGITVAPAAVVFPQNFPVVLEPQQTTALASRVNTFSLQQIPLASISTIGLESEVTLSKALDGFLSRIDKNDVPQLFKLVEQLNDTIASENLPELADKILNGKPSFSERVVGMFSRKKMAQAMERVYEEAGRAITGKTKTLSDMVNSQENKLRIEMNKLNDEMRQFDAVKEKYRECFVSFAVETAYANSVLEKARIEADHILATNEDLLIRNDITAKLQALESRSLALEGALTRLPADQLVIRQLQDAGIGTIQELATTISGRFNSIRQTLLTLHGAYKVQGVQRLGQQGAELDKNLLQVRSKLMKEVVTESATAPGRNREEQAKQLIAVVNDTKALYDLVEKSRETNRQKFDEARTVMAQAREDMLQLGRQTNPGASYQL